MPVTDLNDLFLDMLKDIYYAEKKNLKMMPKMAKALKDTSLAEALENHRDETEGQIDRLEQVFELIGEKAKGKKCAAIEGLSEEADELMDEVESPEVLAAGLLAGAQAVEHYEIARYGTMVEWAKLLGHDEAAELLEETLEQEKATDELLNEMAVGEINQQALDAHAEEESEEEEEEKRPAKSRSATKRRAA